MATIKKTTPSAKSSATKTVATTKPKAGVKKPAASTGVAKKSPSVAVVAQPVTPKKVAAPKKTTAPKKATVAKKAASVSVSRTSNPRTNTVTIKKITRNIVGFYMTEDIEIRRATRSDNVSTEKLKAKYAELKAKAQAKGR